VNISRQSESWDEAFLSQDFSSRQLEVMKNMNIRYECLDARDDFHAQMKKGTTSMPAWAEAGRRIPDGLNLSPSPIQPQTPAVVGLDTGALSSSSFLPNNVRVVDKSYMSRSFSSKVWQQTTQDVSKQFKLNEEQDRAFRIVANHACSPDSDQLKMNIAGMAGTIHYRCANRERCCFTTGFNISLCIRY